MSLVNQYNFPVSLCSFLGDFSSLLIILALLPISINTYYWPPHSTPLFISTLSSFSPFPPLSKEAEKREEGRNTETQTHTMKPFICPIKEAEAQRKVNIHLSLVSLSFSLSLYSLSLSLRILFTHRVRERP